MSARQGSSMFHVEASDSCSCCSSELEAGGREEHRFLEEEHRFLDTDLKEKAVRDESPTNGTLGEHFMKVL